LLEVPAEGVSGSKRAATTTRWASRRGRRQQCTRRR
jgi:hypothetical protein